jgi:hypothetical protein
VYISLLEPGSLGLLGPVGLELSQDLGSLGSFHTIHCHPEELRPTALAVLANEVIQATLVLLLDRERDAGC